MMRRVWLAVLAVALGLSGAAAQAPAAADLLFDLPQFGAAEPGSTLVYRYMRTSALEGVLGGDIEDRVSLAIEPGVSPQARTVRVSMFSQDRHRAAGPFEDVTGNPVLVLFLEHHVETLARALKANPRYLKNAIRAGLRDRAAVTATLVDVAGQSVPGWRIETKPFADDAKKGKMRGLDTLIYTFIAGERVPGAIQSIAARAVDGDGRQLFSESLTYDPSARENIVR